MDYYNKETDSYISDRTVVFKGEEYKVLAKTVTEETIDGIAAPWYLINVEEACKDPSMRIEKVWIFGGYTKILE